MKRNLNNLANNNFDLLIVGGGITGAFLAHDAVLRGLSVALVEKNDFGAFTSSASSKLLHGGIRYLPQGQVWKVRESYRETAIFQHIAPHLTRWVPFLVPTECSSLMKGKQAMQLAMVLYGLCSSGLDRLIEDEAKRPPSRTFLSPEKVREQTKVLDSLRTLTGAQVLWESHMFNSERMTLAVLKSAAHGGAEIANYVEVKKLLFENGVVGGAQVADCLGDDSFEIRARLTINAAGPQVQAINDSVPELQLKRQLTGFSKGVHLVTRQIESDYALAMTTAKKTEGLVSRGGRHFFLIPWRGCSLIGTTNVPFCGDLDKVRVTEKDITDFIDEINAALPEIRLKREDVRYSFCGIYPLVAKDIKADTYQGTGDYQVIDHEKTSGIKGILTTLGAKYTTARYVAEQSVDLAMTKLKRDGACQTRTVRLLEGEIDDILAFRAKCRQAYGQELPNEIIDAMIFNHGRKIDELIADGRRKNLLMRTAIDREVVDIEIEYAVTHEMALTLDDLIFRRTGIGTIGDPGPKTIQHCANIMGNLLGWDVEERERQIQNATLRYDYSS